VDEADLEGILQAPSIFCGRGQPLSNPSKAQQPRCWGTTSWPKPHLIYNGAGFPLLADWESPASQCTICPCPIVIDFLSELPSYFLGQKCRLLRPKPNPMQPKPTPCLKWSKGRSLLRKIASGTKSCFGPTSLGSPPSCQSQQPDTPEQCTT
jgi:hypothetical protein